MLNKDLFDFSIKLLLKEKSSYFFSFFIFTFIVFILSSILFISSSIKYDLNMAIKTQKNIIVYNQKAGKITQISEDFIDEILSIKGVRNVYGKIDGYYYFNQDKRYFHIVSNENIDEEYMLIGNFIKDILNRYYYKDFFNFYVDEKVFKIKIKDNFNNSSNIITNDIIILNDITAQEILSLDENEYSYLEVEVPNDSEIDYIALNIQERYPNLIVKTKTQNLSDLENIFYYKGGIFMIIYIVALVSFFILLYKQISSINSANKKQIAILRSIGFSINNIITIKFIQNIFISLFSYIFAVCLAYLYVFIFNAPLLKNIFISSNIQNNINFSPIIDINILIIIFLFTVIPFLLAIILPTWKVAISDMGDMIR